MICLVFALLVFYRPSIKYVCMKVMMLHPLHQKNGWNVKSNAHAYTDFRKPSELQNCQPCFCRWKSIHQKLVQTISSDRIFVNELWLKNKLVTCLTLLFCWQLLGIMLMWPCWSWTSSSWGLYWTWWVSIPATKSSSAFQNFSIFQSGQYNSLDELSDDLDLMFANAQRYNQDESKLFKVIIARPWWWLPPTAVRMNHERLPRHSLYLATSSMASQGQIWHILNITSSFSATLFWPNFQ
jgi:hypothetical protein